jgi:diguanylate cyclase (GGDEF)-like protein
MDKRQHGRHGIQHPATLILQEGVRLDCSIHNFSLGGLLIRPSQNNCLEEINASIARNTIVAVQVTTPRGSKGSSIIVQSSIVHTSGQTLGVAFLNQETELLDYLHRLSRNQQPQHTNGEDQSSTTPGMGPKETSIFDWIHTCTSKFMEVRYPDFIKNSYNRLFDAANAAADNQTQRELFDAYNILKTSGEEIQELFLEQITSSFNELRNGAQATGHQGESAALSTGMELVEKKDFEEWVSVVSLAQSLDQEIISKLHDLEDLLSSLTNTYIGNESNPVSPYSILWSFNISLAEIGITLEAKKLLFSSLQENIIKAIGTLYDELTQYLNNHGIGSEEPEKTTSKPQPHTPRKRKRLTDTVSSLMSFIGYKDKTGTKQQQQQQGVAPTEMVVRSLDGISSTSQRPIIQRIEEQLSGELVNGHTAVVDSRTRDAIQVSESLLGTLQKEFCIIPEVQRLIENLKIPFVKETINDPNLLNDSNHPGHKLLDTIGKLTPFLPADLEHRSDKGYLYQTLEEISKLSEQGVDLDIREITSHLEHLIDHQKSNFQNNQDIVIRSCEQDELYLQARNTVFDQLCPKLTDTNIPRALEQLLRLGWAGLLVQSISTLGEDNESTKGLWNTVDLLLNIEGGRQQDRSQAEYLINVVTDGFNRYPIHPDSSRNYIAMLEEFLTSGGKQHTELATAQVKLERHQIQQLLDEQTTALHETIVDSGIEQSWLELVGGIEQDHWIVEQRKQGHVRMLNLAWKNPSSTRYVFVDGEGNKSLDRNHNDLALMFKQQQCSLLENGSLPIVERAVNRLLKSTFEQIKNDSNRDELTNLLGRKGFQREVSELLNTISDPGDHHVMLELDIDQFSMINDLCGIKGGDKLLQTFASIISNYLPENTLLARIGDDEFGILLKDSSVGEAFHVAEMQRRAMENLRYTWDGTAVPATASVGILVIDANTRSVTEVLNKASAACHLAKQDGGNCSRIYQPTDNDIEKQKQLAKAVPIIEEALEKNKLSLFAQPITPLFLGEEEENHYEILLRVQTDDGSWIGPVEFIQAAEKYNRMRSVDRWVINQFFAWLENHHEELEGTGFSINLSAQSLDDATFPIFINNHLERSPFPSDRLTFEITETSLVKHIDESRLLVEEMKSKGVRFSLDDFGTGYSSYSYLKDFPVDVVKIDGVFVQDMLTESSSYAMVKSITEISHHMGKKVVAEYVENEAILVALRELEVDFAQGFVVGHPVPIRNLLKEYV